jgi:murein DD-endopeptidase MepM/ murein hydrolase activator NlpD
MANKKIWHVIITGNDSKSVKSYSFSKTLAIFAFVFVILLLLCSGILNYFFFVNQIDRTKMKDLQTHNIQLKSEMKRINSLIDTMKLKLENLQEQDKKVRELESMRTIDDDIRQMGVGGIQFVDSTFYSYNEDLFTLHNTLLNKMDLVQRQLDFEISSYEEIVRFIAVKNTIFRHTPSVKPAQGRITDTYGWRIHPIKKIRQFHHGIDIANNIGTLVRTTADGKVRETGYDKDYGRYILIDNGYGYETFYAHLNKQYVKNGDPVTKYQIIGEMGNSGSSTGPHLHYEVRFYGRSKNPLSYFNKERATIFVDKRYLR